MARELASLLSLMQQQQQQQQQPQALPTQPAAQDFPGLFDDGTSETMSIGPLEPFSTDSFLGDGALSDQS